MPKNIEIPFGEAYGDDALKNLTATLKRIAAPHEKPRTEEIRYLNAVLATFTRIADALDAIHGTLAEALLVSEEVAEVKEVRHDPE